MPKHYPKMFSKPKSWLSGSIWRPKNPHSLEHLKFLYNLLCKNQTVTEQNRALLVETLRSISEILIWGDQNDSSVFDFFLEKNMLSFFLRYLQQRFGRFICVQLLQTLNILFENISNETSLYYLLSNNHINSIIIHKFDFSDEEVMAYYISFLKTLSLKLNKHTIHFFYNEHTNDFALYTEAIKFFNHAESMVRIAVRTITLNVFRVDDKAMLSYIRNRTAAPYFSNLVWFIGNHILDLDTCVRHDHDHRSRDRLADLVAEHLDHLHYLNDIFLIDIHTLNEVLTDKLLNRLLIPLYVYSLTKRKKFTEESDDRKHISCVVSLFLLSQVFLIIRSPPLIQQLAEVIFQGDMALAQPSHDSQGSRNSPNVTRRREFRQPRESLEKTLENTRPIRRYDPQQNIQSLSSMGDEQASSSAVGTSVEVLSSPSTEGARSPSSEVCSGDTELSSPTQNSTDEEKLMGRTRLIRPSMVPENPQNTFTLENRPYLESIFLALECSENDYAALFALCLLYAVGKSDGVSQTLLDSVLLPTDRSTRKDGYNLYLVERLIRIIELACQTGNKVRLATLEMSIKLLKLLVNTETQSFLQDRHLACIENAKECCTQMLRNFYKSEEIFLDMFEDEYREMKTHPLNVEYMMQDASILLPPTGTPLTGINFNKRLPCGEVERARKAIRVFFLVRDLSLTLLHETETQLPLTKENVCIKTNDVLDLNNSDLIACTVTRESRRQERRFLVIDPVQLILVEPDSKRLGWGVVKFVGFLQDVEVTGDKDDSRLLHVVVHKPQATIHAKPVPILSARFVFDDHIRCMAAKQRLIKGRQRARQQKMTTIERLLDIAQDMERGHFTRSGPIPGRSHPVRVDTSAKSSPINIPQSSSASQQQPTTAAAPTTSTLLAHANAAAAGSRPARRVTPEQRKMLQAKAAQRIKSRQQQQQQSQQEQQSITDGATKQSMNIPGSAKQVLDIKDEDGSNVVVEANSASAALTLNNTKSSSSDIGIGAIRGNVLRSAQLWPAESSSSSSNSNNSFAIPMEDLSQSRFSRGRAYSSERAPKPLKMVSQREMFKFQRSLSHSPSRSIVKNPDTSALLYSEKYEATRRLSAPGMVGASLNRHIPTPASVSKVSTATQVGRTYTSFPKEQQSSMWAEKVDSSSHTPATMRHHVVSATATLIPDSDLSMERRKDEISSLGEATPEGVSLSQSIAMGGARPKQPLMGPPPPPAPPVKAQAQREVAAGGGGSGTLPLSRGNVQELSLQGLQRAVPSAGASRDSGDSGASAISPETPSSDSAVSSDASMISLSSMAGSESSMDVDSDNNAAATGSAMIVAGAIGGVGIGGMVRPAGSASQQLTQLAQMVQEHYPYSSSPGDSAKKQQNTG